MFMLKSMHYWILFTDAVKPSVTAYDAIVSGSLSQFIAASNKIGGDVQTQVNNID
jgi:hypothetical protein